MNQMTPKDRVAAALKKQPTDRVPIYMWFHPETTEILARMLEVPPNLVEQAMGNDVLQTWVNNNWSLGGVALKEEQFYTDEWGIEWTRQDAFNQIVGFPLADKDREQVLEYQFPSEYLDKLLGRMEDLAGFSDEYFIGCDVSPCVFEMYWRLRGMNEAMIEISADKELASTMFARCADFAIELSKRACEQYPLDWLWTGDDAASQTSMLFSPDCWRELVKPNLKRVIDVGKRAGIYVAFHSCGAIRPIIPDLIEIGVDVLNPIQCNCKGMGPIDLKREFGNELAFMGGVDTQGLLPNGSADEVRLATERLIDGMTTDGGGYILAASHTIPPETPLENIFAMYEVAGLSREKILDAAADLRGKLKPLESP
jgi:uroporphyrinogen decarboxylase